MAAGKNGRRHEYLVSVRGTFKTSAHDWLSNIRMGGVVGPSGYTVHAEFYAAMPTLLPQIRQATREIDKVSTIHVVGHSLGGG